MMRKDEKRRPVGWPGPHSIRPSHIVPGSPTTVMTAPQRQLFPHAVKDACVRRCRRRGPCMEMEHVAAGSDASSGQAGVHAASMAALMVLGSQVTSNDLSPHVSVPVKPTVPCRVAIGPRPSMGSDCTLSFSGTGKSRHRRLAMALITADSMGV